MDFKKVIGVVALIFVFFVFNCTTTKQETAETVEPTQETEKNEKVVVGSFDPSGTWIMTNKWPDFGCDDSFYVRVVRRNNDFKERMTVEISQKGNTIKLVHVEPNRSFDGIINNNIISLNDTIFISTVEQFGGTLRFKDYTLTVGPNANTLTGKTDWEYWDSKKHGGCICTSNLILKRKLK